MEYDSISTSARVREWKHLTGRDFQEMDRANTVVVVSCSPLEVHGPHLPTITDNQEAEGLSLRMMEILSERHPTIEFVHLPPIFVACDVLPHAGSLQFKPQHLLRGRARHGTHVSEAGVSTCLDGEFPRWSASLPGDGKPQRIM